MSADRTFGQVVDGLGVVLAVEWLTDLGALVRTDTAGD